MSDYSDIIQNLESQAQDKEQLDNGENGIRAENARALRDAVILIRNLQYIENHPPFYIRDRLFNSIHGYGEDQHDSTWVDNDGTLHYHNLQNGEGCDANSINDEDAAYEFCPMLDDEIDERYLKEHGLENEFRKRHSESGDEHPVDS